MKTRSVMIFALLICAALLTACYTFVPSGRVFSAEAFDTNYGFVAKNASSRIVLKNDCVWLQAESATTGDIFDYVYKKTVNPSDLEINYRVVNDTTRDNGTHSRFNIYILPSANASVNDGVKIQMIQHALGADSEEVKHKLLIAGPGSGMQEGKFNDDYSVNLKIYKQNGTFFLDVNGTSYPFSGANAGLLETLANNGSAYLRFTAHFQENGESSYGGDYALFNINDTKFGSDFGTQEDRLSDIGSEAEDKFEGVYGDDIKGKLEFTRYDFNNLTPEGTLLNYSITEDGLALFGRNEENGFSAGISYQPELVLDRTNELSFTLRMPDEVYCTTPEYYAEYSVFVCAEPNTNFSGTVSLYLRLSYKPGTEKGSSASPAVLEVIMWDNASDNPVKADTTVNIKPKTEEGHEHEITFRIVYDETASCYKLYVNGQRASSRSVELSMTEYFDKMAKKYLSATVSYSTADRTSGGFRDTEDEMIGMTLKSVNGLQIVNEEPDIEENMAIIVNKVTSDTAMISWTDPIVDETDFDAPLCKFDGYRVIRLIGETDETGMVTTKEDGEFFIDNIDDTSFNDSNLKPGTNYYYTVYAVRKNDDGTYKNVLSSDKNKRVQTLAAESSDPTDNPVNPTDKPSSEPSETTAEPSSAPSETEEKKKNILPVILIAVGVLAALAVVTAVLIKKKKG